MKVRVTLMTENDKPIEVIGDNPEEKIKRAWDMVLTLISAMSENGDTAYVESVEILRDESDE